MTDFSQAAIPEVPSVPKFTALTELELQTIRKALIEHNGDIDAAGITLEQMRNVVYTCRLKGNPMAESESLPKAAKPKKEKGGSTNRSSVSGIDINNFLG